MNKKLTNILRTNVTLYFICLVLFALAAIPFDVRLAIGEGAAAVVLLPELVPYAAAPCSRACASTWTASPGAWTPPGPATCSLPRFP